MVRVNRPRFPRVKIQQIKEAIESGIDRADKAINIGLKAGVAYTGYRALRHPLGALVGLLGLRLAESPNLASGVAGVAALTGLGTLNLFPPPPPAYGAARPVEDTLALLQSLGLWRPTEIPISERPTEQTYIETYGGYYITE